MKAIVVSAFGDESVMEYTEASVPEPGHNEVRVRMMAAGVNPVETYIRSGNYGSLPDLPYTPGNDGAGIVDALGDGVSHVKKGERVFVAAALARRNTGTYAEYCVCDAAAVQALPERISFEQGAGLGTPGLAACYALFAKAEIRPGDKVLVHGASGGVGTLAVQLARQAGAVVSGTAGDDTGQALLRGLGAAYVFNHREDGYVDAMKKVFPEGPDVIVEMLANSNLRTDLSLIAKYGRIVIVGNRGEITINPRDIMAKDSTVRGIMIGNMTEAVYAENMYRLHAALENGMRVVVDRVLGLKEAPEAHKAVIGDKKAGKIILAMGESR